MKLTKQQRETAKHTGRAGGKAAASRMSKRARKQRASLAAKARWGDNGKS